MTDYPRSARRLLLFNLALAGGYIALAIVAKLLFSWEAIAATLWPAAGIANAAVLIFGPAVAPAVALGNLIGSACNPDGRCSADPWFLLIGLGAAAQALLIRSVLRRQHLIDNNLSRPSKLLWFLLWTGPLGCWPAATIYAISMLEKAEDINAGLTRALFWWVGDSMGSLVLLPALLVLLPRSQPIWRERRRILLLPLLFLLLLLSILSCLGKLLAESITQVPELVEPMQQVRLLLSSTLLLIACGGVGLLLFSAGTLLEKERELRRSRLAADSAGALLHEIGQPLLRLQLWLERLHSSLKRQSIAETLSEATNALMELENLSKSSLGIQELTLSGIRDTKEARLNTALATVNAQVSALLERMDQKLKLSVHTSELRIPIGQAQLEAALRNLVVNASHAAGEGGVIKLGIKRLGDALLVRVEDSGPGFDQQAKANVGARMVSSWGGQGIGLLIVRRVVDEAEGSLNIGRSITLGGACVELRLPLI